MKKKLSPIGEFHSRSGYLSPFHWTYANKLVASELFPTQLHSIPDISSKIRNKLKPNGEDNKW